mmetsp:Transcript_39925/g.85522  ORF Transcript_39925/g.85522 Transcript_39925/m.85522 type:complete len:426 (+) Transcript_39925:223-1500(+)|eukprot:CAMPEP_0206431862 /NCGR_PEP_ID=MMETSP0324_2-20121206/7594_1 /ASSEMBLY_ACC=CAM_ASM_000836 /TAXON_ID=2866 /ORGANISM="Crypthecodinium cohnii, Strain Seligo" /LENGTH=425 /DNA_ID=CAMNT_0053897825 /DNA_START=223 /DNA_END=1500 /DNA_ORIENTATION=-
MGGEASRFCRLPLKKSRVQKLSSGSTSTVTHIKGKEFEQLIPSEPGPEKTHIEHVSESSGQVHETPMESYQSIERIESENGLGPPEVLAFPGSTGGQSLPHPDKPMRSSRKASTQNSQLRSSSTEDLHHHCLRQVRGDGETKKIRQSFVSEGSGGGAVARNSISSKSKSGSKIDLMAKPPVRSNDRTASCPAGAVGRPFPKRPIGCKLSSKCWLKLETLFRLMDEDGSNAVTRDEAKSFFQGAFSNLSVDAMFNEVDTDGSGAITSEEFIKFWLQVRGSGYKEQDILDELDELIEGGAWVDWKDGRDTVAHEIKFPKRPMLCRLSAKTWDKCEELFHLMSNNDEKMQITRDKAQHFFKGAFCNISADAMFNEIDLNHHGVITPKEFMRFWTQLKSYGYKDKDIREEVENLMEGNPWVDWKDGRRT